VDEKLKEAEGITRAIYFPSELDKTIETARRRLGMNRSRFVSYAVMRFLEQLMMLRETVHPNEPHENLTPTMGEENP